MSKQPELFKRPSLDQVTEVPESIISVYVVEQHIWAEGSSPRARAARQVERQAEAEGAAVLHLCDALEHLLGCEEVEPTELIVLAPVTPGRALWTMLPTLH